MTNKMKQQKVAVKQAKVSINKASTKVTKTKLNEYQKMIRNLQRRVKYYELKVNNRSSSSVSKVIEFTGYNLFDTSLKKLNPYSKEYRTVVRQLKKYFGKGGSKKFKEESVVTIIGDTTFNKVPLEKVMLAARLTTKRNKQILMDAWETNKYLAKIGSELPVIKRPDYVSESYVGEKGLEKYIAGQQKFTSSKFRKNRNNIMVSNYINGPMSTYPQWLFDAVKDRIDEIGYSSAVALLSSFYASGTYKSLHYSIFWDSDQIVTPKNVSDILSLWGISEQKVGNKND